jgi:hypothetical protein
MSDCPCIYADKPCDPRCTCFNSFSSRGCACCATYGSEEQRKENANRLVRQASDLATTLAKIARYEAAIETAEKSFVTDPTILVGEQGRLAIKAAITKIREELTK